MLSRFPRTSFLSTARIAVGQEAIAAIWTIRRPSKRRPCLLRQVACPSNRTLDGEVHHVGLLVANIQWFLTNLADCSRAPMSSGFGLRLQSVVTNKHLCLVPILSSFRAGDAGRIAFATRLPTRAIAGQSSAMCNLYSLTKGPQAIRDFVRATLSDVGNCRAFRHLPAPIAPDRSEGREIDMTLGMPRLSFCSTAGTPIPPS